MISVTNILESIYISQKAVIYNCQSRQHFSQTDPILGMSKSAAITGALRLALRF